MTKTNVSHFSREKDWWRGAVIYQIYPRSFQDSNNDGIGDLAGISSRMPYIASLGVDAIWISPFFTSPMKDFGYDVSDYRGIDPMFGTMDDFDALIECAHQNGLKVMIDLVLSHTSDQHAWFKESRQNKENDKSNWYVWADAKEDGNPPNNWLSIFGGSAWQWDPRRLQYYLHNFLTSQPDLNFHEPQVQDALLDVARFWLERGVDGFRLDTINFYTHDKQLRDNPGLPKDQITSRIAPAENPYGWQQHLYDKNQPENIDFLKKLRAVMEPYNAAAVGEVGDEQLGLEIMGEYTSGDDLMHMCYAFELLSGQQPSASYIKDVMDHVERVAEDGWACWAYSNHDVKRHKTRWDLGGESSRAFTTLMMCLKGSACIYQGEELGFDEADVAFEELQDPYGVEFWPTFKGRDGCRTPIAWENTNQNGGFSNADKTWLPVSPTHLSLSAQEAEKDPNALIHHYRKAIKLRAQHDVLRQGEMKNVRANGSVLSFDRIHTNGEVIQCHFNLSNENTSITTPSGKWDALGKDLGAAQNISDTQIHLGPWQPVILLKK